MRVTSETSPTSHLRCGWTAVGQVVAQLSESDEPCSRGILIVSDSTNTADIFVSGSPDVVADATKPECGFRLPVGQAVVIPCTSANEIFLISATDNQRVNWMLA